MKEIIPYHRIKGKTLVLYYSRKDPRCYSIDYDDSVFINELEDPFNIKGKYDNIINMNGDDPPPHIYYPSYLLKTGGSFYQINVSDNIELERSGFRLLGREKIAFSKDIDLCIDDPYEEPYEYPYWSEEEDEDILMEAEMAERQRLQYLRNLRDDGDDGEDDGTDDGTDEERDEERDEGRDIDKKERVSTIYDGYEIESGTIDTRVKYKLPRKERSDEEIRKIESRRCSISSGKIIFMFYRYQKDDIKHLSFTQRDEYFKSISYTRRLKSESYLERRERLRKILAHKVRFSIFTDALSTHEIIMRLRYIDDTIAKNIKGKETLPGTSMIIYYGRYDPYIYDIDPNRCVFMGNHDYLHHYDSDLQVFERKRFDNIIISPFTPNYPSDEEDDDFIYEHNLKLAYKLLKTKGLVYSNNDIVNKQLEEMGLSYIGERIFKIYPKNLITYKIFEKI